MIDEEVLALWFALLSFRRDIQVRRDAEASARRDAAVVALDDVLRQVDQVFNLDLRPYGAEIKDRWERITQAEAAGKIPNVMEAVAQYTATTNEVRSGFEAACGGNTAEGERRYKTVFKTVPSWLLVARGRPCGQDRRGGYLWDPVRFADAVAKKWGVNRAKLRAALRTHWPERVEDFAVDDLFFPIVPSTRKEREDTGKL